MTLTSADVVISGSAKSGQLEAELVTPKAIRWAGLDEPEKMNVPANQIDAFILHITFKGLTHVRQDTE